MWQKIELYIISLWFLFVLLFIDKIDIPYCYGENCNFIGFDNLLLLNLTLPIIFSLFFIFIGIIFYLRFNYKIVEGASNLPKKITRLESLNFETLSFLITYVVPLVCFDLGYALDRPKSLLMLFLILALIGWIYVKTNIFYTNPTLAVLGYRIYKIDTDKSTGMIIIIRQKVEIGDNIYPKKIDENIFFAKKKKDE